MSDTKSIQREILDTEVWPYVSTPAQYIGGELNQIVKDPDTVAVNWALAFPDTYAIGMSHLGLKILYHVINSIPDAAAQRVFCPWMDMEQRMRELDVPLYALETLTPIKEFDIVGFSLMFELTYTNVLTMLDLAGIPIHAKDRTDGDPLICGGGQCILSAEPMADFFDFLVNGEGEGIVVEITDVIRDAKEKKLSRADTLLRLAREVAGIYVPGFFTPEYNTDGTIREIGLQHEGIPVPVERVYVKDLDAAPFPTAPVVAWTESIHDRYAVEIMRGCVNGCRFCQAGMITRPQRLRSIETIVKLVSESFLHTGYEEIGLLSLSSSDYPGIVELAEEILKICVPRGISLSLPSLRVRSVVGKLSEAMATVRKSALTLAPEAAGEELRKMINKPISNDELFENVLDAYRQGYKRVKLYFMIGFPGETDDDVRGIAELSDEISRLNTQLGRPPARVNVSVNTIVPKPGTPFQRIAQIDTDEMQRKRALILDSSRVRAVKYHFSNVQQSQLEAVLARGDRRLGPVIETVWRNGARFDSWSECWNFERWSNAMAQHGLTMEFYANRERENDEILPWTHLTMGVGEEFLQREAKRANAEKPSVTPSCGVTPEGDLGHCFDCHGCERSPTLGK